MSLAVLAEAGLSFGQRAILDQLSLRIAKGDRIGVIGPNGSGKTTLLRVLAGHQPLDRGHLKIHRGTRVGYLRQEIDLVAGISLRDYVLSSVPGRASMDGELATAEEELAALSSEPAGDPERDEKLMDLATQIADLHEQIDHFDRYFSEHEAYRILAGLGFRDHERNRDLGEFSGGWQMRAVLAALLFQQNDLLLLDEPTNHLDMPSVAWFSDFLRRYQRAFCLISHDREFLNEQIDRVVSFEPEAIRQYSGNYDQYRRQRAEEEQILINRARNIERERERMQRFVDRFRAQANKAAAVQSRVKALAKLEDVELHGHRKVMHFRFPSAERSVTEVVRLEQLGKSFGSTHVFDGVNLVVRRGAKVAIIGPNGAGKTTLLKIIAGELEASSGAVSIGNNVTTGYYAQHHAEALVHDATVTQEVSRANPDASPGTVRGVCGALLFSGDDVDKKIAVLSGGERARVALARLLVRPGNLLLMDEPSNHLDLESSERLAEGLTNFDGTLIFVSHNRSLIRSVANTIWNIEDGRVEEYGGTLDEYMYSMRLRYSQEPDESRATESPTESERPDPEETDAGSESATRRSRASEKARRREEAERRKVRNRVLGPLQNRISTLEERISALEAEQAQRSEQLSDPAVYERANERNRLMGEFQNAADKLQELTGRWEALVVELEEKTAELDTDEP